ncbi:glycosyltransferase family 2 protein [Georgenia sp. Marseille-Q6866]
MTTDSSFRILVGVPTYRRPWSLRALLEQLTTTAANARSMGITVDVVIVDNDPESSAKEVTHSVGKDAAIRYEVENRPGVSHVRNHVLAHFGEEYDALIFVDDDQALEAGWFEGYVRAHRRWPNDILSGYVAYAVPTDADRYARAWYESKRTKNHGSLVASTGTGNVLIPRRAWIRSGVPQFDPLFGQLGGEDSDFFRKFAAHGVSIRQLQDVRVTEAVAPTRAERDWVRQRIVRQGEIWATIYSREGHRGRSLVQGVGRIVAGSVKWVASRLRAEPAQPSNEAWVLTGYGYLKGALGRRSAAYGGDHSV